MKFRPALLLPLLFTIYSYAGPDLRSPGSSPSPPLQSRPSFSDLKTIFLHVLGDVFGRDTSFEGSNAHVLLPYRIKQLKAILEHITPKDPRSGYLGEVCLEVLKPAIPADLIIKLIKQAETALD